MSRFTIILLISLLFVRTSFAQVGTSTTPLALSECDPECIIDGNILLFSDDWEIEVRNCSIVEGNVSIIGSPLENLDALNCIQEVRGSLIIENNRRLTDIRGLSRLIEVRGNVDIHGNESLENLEGLHHLSSIGGYLDISCNSLLTSFAPIDDAIRETSFQTTVDGDQRLLLISDEVSSECNNCDPMEYLVTFSCYNNFQDTRQFRALMMGRNRDRLFDEVNWSIGARISGGLEFESQNWRGDFTFGLGFGPSLNVIPRDRTRKILFYIDFGIALIIDREYLGLHTETNTEIFGTLGVFSGVEFDPQGLVALEFFIMSLAGGRQDSVAVGLRSGLRVRYLFALGIEIAHQWQTNISSGEHSHALVVSWSFLLPHPYFRG